MRRIAMVAPLTGPVAPVGESAVAAVRLALSDLGNPLELTVVDDGCKPAHSFVCFYSCHLLSIRFLLLP